MLVRTVRTEWLQCSAASNTQRVLEALRAMTPRERFALLTGL
jgi:hypothetical protein